MDYDSIYDKFKGVMDDKEEVNHVPMDVDTSREDITNIVTIKKTHNREKERL